MESCIKQLLELHACVALWGIRHYGMTIDHILWHIMATAGSGGRKKEKIESLDFFQM